MAEINRELQLTIEGARREAASRRHAYLTVEHLLLAIVHDGHGAEVMRQLGVNVEVLRDRLDSYLEKEIDKTEGEDDEGSHPMRTLAFQRVMENAVQHAANAGHEETGIPDFIVAIFSEPDSYARMLLHRHDVSMEDLVEYLEHGFVKRKSRGHSDDSFGDAEDGAFGEAEKEPRNLLEAYALNLTKRAEQGELDPMIGRRRELDRAVHVLARRRKNNPIFVGESGVGKTALAEGLAQRIHEGLVPKDLANAEIFSLDIAGLLAGTRYRGDFEERFKILIKELQERDNPLMFIDEIHNALGAGSAQGSSVDVSSMLKPLLQSGALSCIGSTTYREYRHFERDRALARRFQRIDVPEPTRDEANQILSGLASRYEAHHGVRYTRPALRACVELSARYLTDRFLPDKAIDVMDEAGAAVKLERRGPRGTVGVRDIEELIARMTGTPPPRADRSDRKRLEELESDIRGVVFGQDAAVSSVVRAIKRARAGLGAFERPLGAFLFMGPTGVGKTELARQLARTLNMPFLRFDMSEYMEKHAVARLIGAPPGYVGYDEGGQLVERVRKQPNSVLLLDEIEKAHRDIYDILLQVMDRATLTDNHGREADFRHTVLIMTSNVGSRDFAKNAIGFAGEQHTGKGEVERVFSPEFRNRLDEIVRFNPLPPQVMERVVEKFIVPIVQQLGEKKVVLRLLPEARAWLAEKGYDPHMGARPLARVIQSELQDRLSDELLFGALVKGGEVEVGVASDNTRLELRFGAVSSDQPSSSRAASS